MSDWRWTEDGEPVLDVMPGYEATIMRLEDLDSWLGMDPDYVALSEDDPQKAILREEGEKTVKRLVERGKRLSAAFRAGEVVKASPMWMIRDTETGQAVCRINFNPVPEAEQDLPTRSIGWVTLPSHRDKGIAGRSAGAIFAKWGGEAMKLESITAETRSDNLASLSLLKRLGFEKTGEIPIPQDMKNWELRGGGTMSIFRKPLRSAGAETTAEGTQ